MSKKLTLLLVLSSISKTIAQNVSVNSTGAVAHASAMLDIDDASKGILIPRVILTARNVSLPVTGTLPNSLLVFNTATNTATAGEEVYPGYYYWDLSTLKWVALAGSGSKNWSILGNSATVAGTNFLGTTDDIDLIFKINNVKAGQLNRAGLRTAFGYEAGLTATGNGNSFFGNQAGKATTTGTFNTALGYGAYRFSSNAGSENTHIGTNAGANWNTASARGNTGVGMSALQGVTASTGTFNSALGYAAGSGFILGTGALNGFAITTGSFNTFLGYSSAMNAGSYSNSTAVGSFSLFDASNVIVLGSINGINQATATTNTLIGRISNFATNVPMVYTSSALQIENTAANRNGIYIRNTGTGGSAGVGAYSENYIGVFGTTVNFAGVYGGVVGVPATKVTGTVGTTRVNASFVPEVITPNAAVGIAGTSVNAGYAGYFHNLSGAGWAVFSDGDHGSLAGGSWIISDRNLKTNISDMQPVMSKIMQLRPVTYNFKPEYGISQETKLGFISQEVGSVFPNLVRVKSFPNSVITSADGKETKLSESPRPETATYMDMESMTPLIIKALQEQQVQIELLKAEIKALKEAMK